MTSVVLIGLLALNALETAVVVAQDELESSPAAPAPAKSLDNQRDERTADDRDALQPTSGRALDEPDPRGELKGPPIRYFFDDFSGASLERRHWEITAGATLIRDVLDRGQPVAAACLGTEQHEPDQPPELRSAAIRLAGVPRAELSYLVQHRGVEAGERLLVEYLSSQGRWQTIERVVADGRDSVAFSRHIHLLPEDALHAAFRVRFRSAPDDGDDAWYLGEVLVVGPERMPALTVRMRPALGARVTAVAAGDSERLDGATPFTRFLPAGTRVHLAAPPTAGGRVFSHWSIDGAPDAERERVLTLSVSEAVEVVANYRPSVAGRSEASVAIISLPEPGVPIALGPDPERLYAQVNAETEYGCLTGEWLALLAPARTERLVFAGWVVNGQAPAGSDNLLEHRVTGDDVLLAEYVLLGDLNGDGALDKFDVDVFVAALIDPAGYAQQYPELDRVRRGDINGDGVFDALDVEGFVDLLLND
jgi:hypothetical protein